MNSDKRWFSYTTRSVIESSKHDCVIFTGKVSATTMQIAPVRRIGLLNAKN